MESLLRSSWVLSTHTPCLRAKPGCSWQHVFTGEQDAGKLFKADEPLSPSVLYPEWSPHVFGELAALVDWVGERRWAENWSAYANRDPVEWGMLAMYSMLSTMGTANARYERQPPACFDNLRAFDNLRTLTSPILPRKEYASIPKRKMQIISKSSNVRTISTDHMR